jgi:CxxC-x17-CxxC domain-containing protein
MGNFNRGGDRGGFKSGGGRGGDRGGDRGGFDRPRFEKKSWDDRGAGNRGDVTMFSATCSDCGKRCEVPFRPTSGKPVFCSDCFGGKKEPSQGGDRFSPKRQFQDRGAVSSEGNDGVKRQLADMNVKLDRLIKAVEALGGASSKPVVVEAQKVAYKKEDAKIVNTVELKKVIDLTVKKKPAKVVAPVKEVKTAVKKEVKKAVKKTVTSKKK